MRVLVAEALADEGIAMLRAEAEVDVLLDLDHAGLVACIERYDAVIVRSATEIDAEVIGAGTNLKVIGRAGVGVDNIDVESATLRGVVVVNAPQSNMLSATEHTLALILSLARNVPAADASLRASKWERNRFTGVELYGKTLGILGLGRIGTLVAQRASSFGMKIIAYDPYVSKSRAQQLGIELVPTVEEVCAQSDFITIHMPKNAETKHMIGPKELSLMKPTARIVNVARGGIIDEDALADALKQGRIAGAALDVFEKEPPGDHPLMQLENVVATPHLGASTEEAQTKAGTSIAEQVLLALKGELAPFAVNIQGGAEFVEVLRPYIPLTEKLGRVLTGVAGSGINEIKLEVLGEIAEHDTRILTLAGLKGLFSAIVHEPVTYVNAPLLATQRGIDVSETKSSVSQDYVNLVVMRAETDHGTVTVAGALVGKKDEERIVRVYDYSIDMMPERFMCFLRYADRPGVIGKVGTVLGEGGINIASMQVSRETFGGEALMGLTVDDAIPIEVLDAIVKAIEATDAKFIDLG